MNRARIWVMKVANPICHVVKKSARRVSNLLDRKGQHTVPTYGSLEIGISTESQNHIKRGSEDSLNLAVASTHLLKRITLELSAIHRLVNVSIGVNRILVIFVELTRCKMQGVNQCWRTGWPVRSRVCGRLPVSDGEPW